MQKNIVSLFSTIDRYIVLPTKLFCHIFVSLSNINVEYLIVDNWF